MAESKANSVHVVSLSAYTRPEVVEDRRKEWVAYGADNDHFRYLIDRYTGSTTNQAVIDGKARLIYGKGISATDKAKKVNDWVKFKSMLPDEDLERVVRDNATYEHFAFLVTRKGGKTKISHWPMETLRAAKMAEGESEVKRWFYHPNWSERKNRNSVDDLEVFYSYEQGSKREEQILVFKRYVPGYYYYNVVSYEASVPYALLEEEIADYLINDVQTGFSGTKVINFNNGEAKTEEERKLIVQKVKDTLTGARGEKVIVAFNRDETKKTTVEDIPLNDAPTHYEYLSKECEAKILKGHKAPSVLLGFNADSQGFSNNAEELRNKMLAFDNYVIKTFQKDVTTAIQYILADEEISLDLFFETLEPIEFSEEPQQEPNTNLSADRLPDLADFIAKGEAPAPEWELIDEREVDYALEEELDAQVREWEAALQPKQSLMQRAWNLVSTGVAKTNVKSEQDAWVGDNYYKVRYRYDKSLASTAAEISRAATSGEATKHRPFCKAMESAGKLYRKEDIQSLSDKVVNPGFGPNGTDIYDIWKYKGGPWCGHRWVRVTYKNNNSFQAIKDSDKISNAQAEREGYRVRNEPEVSQPPRFMPKNGYK